MENRQTKYQKKRKRKKKSIKKYVGVIAILGGAFFFALMLFVGRGAKTINSNAKRVRANKCVAFYPRETEQVGKAFVKNLCKTAKQETVYDYKTYKLKGYHCYDYGNNNTFLVDEDFNEAKVTEFNDKAKMIISDYLRYTMKADGRDEAYTREFMEQTYYPNIKKEDVKYNFNKEYFVCQFDRYNIKVDIPLKYIAEELGLDLGIEKEDYVKPVYIDPNRPVVAMTFDDGPSADASKTNRLLDELYKYDATATFYVVGRVLNDETVPIIEKGLKYGNQYGSHSQTHANLVKLTEDQIKQEIMGVSDFFKEQFNYKMTTYRPPYGSYNETVDKVVPLAAVLWDVDSGDWQLKNANAIASKLMEKIGNGSVVLLHDIHDASVQAVVEGGVIRSLIDKGYQLVKVDDLAKIKGVELTQGVHFCWD